MQKIVPFLWLDDKAAEAAGLYTSLFKGSRIEQMERHEGGQGELEGTLRHARCSLGGLQFMAMDGGLQHLLTFTPALSF